MKREFSNNFNFKFDKKLQNSFYSSNYFIKSKKIVSKFQPNNIVWQQFCSMNSEPFMVCGIEECVKLIKNTLPKNILKQIKVYGLKDGQIVKAKQPILIIIGKYQHFAFLENIIDGILARRSSVANNCYQLLKIVPSNKVIFMADRSDDYLLQPYDGYAAYVGGIRNFVTDASVSLIKDKKSLNINGTIPHALIQIFDGNLSKTIQAYQNIYGKNKTVALIDYHNNVKKEIIELRKKITDLFAIRIDTSKNLVDVSLPDKKENYGVSDNLIKLARKTLDQVGWKNTKIIISSGLNLDRIKQIINKKIPADIFGVGASLNKLNLNITGDLVIKNNKHQAKFGRQLFIDPKKINKVLNRYI